MKVSTSIPRMHADQTRIQAFRTVRKAHGMFFGIYNELGHGFLESVYEQAFAVALAEQSVFFQRQIAVPVSFSPAKDWGLPR